mgnify:CR=1 FL=1
MDRNNSFLERNTYCVLGLPFDVTNLQGAVDKVNSSLESSTPCFISTPNLNFVIATQSDTDFFDSVVESDLSVADGMPLIWVAKLLGVPITERVAGSTLFDELSKQPRDKKIKVYFFGGQEGVAQRAHQQLNDTSVGMVSCGFYDPGFVSIDQMSDVAIIEEINAAKPDFIVVALGAKKGQAWIQKNRGQLHAPVISHLGAVINFVAGGVERAPIAWQRLGLEWVWRIKQEPALWKRYLLDGTAFIVLMMTKVLPLAVYDRVLKKRTGYNRVNRFEHKPEGRDTIRLSGSFRYGQLALIKKFLSSILERKQANDGLTTVVLDVAGVEYLDGAFIATLLLFQQGLQVQDRAMVLMNVSTRIKWILFMNNVHKRFTVQKGE